MQVLGNCILRQGQVDYCEVAPPVDPALPAPCAREPVLVPVRERFDVVARPFAPDRRELAPVALDPAEPVLRDAVELVCPPAPDIVDPDCPLPLPADEPPLVCAEAVAPRPRTAADVKMILMSFMGFSLHEGTA